MTDANDATMEADTQARERALDVSASFVVQAPAGSGKTELLIQRYLKLLSVVDNPEEILAITFTRKAAAEMQVRVLDALNSARNNVVPDEPHLRITFELARQALGKSKNLDWNLIGNPRRLRIMTMDSLNASIARALPLSGPEYAGGARIVVGAEQRALHRAAAIASLDWLTEKGVFQAATACVLTHVDNNVELYTSYLARMLATRDQWLPFVASGDVDAEHATALRAQLEGNLAHTVNLHLRSIFDSLKSVDLSVAVAHFDLAADNLIADGAAENEIIHVAGLNDIPSADAKMVDQWRGLAGLLLTKQGGVRKRLNKNQGFPPSVKEQKLAMESQLVVLAKYPDVVRNLHSVRMLPPTAYSDDQWSVLLALFRLLPLAVGELKRLFSLHGAIDHTEVALIANAALGTVDAPGDVALLLDYQIRHLLVDEMQDTSHSQYRMLESLTGGWESGDGRSLYCVGDPMQSIYRFRNAEVGQFLLMQQHGFGHIALEPLLLQRNFRSGEYLVDWFNAVFPQILAANNDEHRGAVSYSPALTVPQLQGRGEVVVHPIFDQSPDVEAMVGLQVIQKLLAEHPDESIAILVRGRTQLPQLLAQLRRENIDYRAVEIDRLTDLPEIIDLLSLTRATVHLGDRIAWLGVLRGAWIGLDWSDLHALVGDDKRACVWDLVNDSDRCNALSEVGRRAVQKALPILQRLLAPSRTLGLRDRIEEAWLALGGPAILNEQQEVENAYRYLAILQRIEVAGSLSDVAQLESILEQEHVSSSGDSQLQVMTMHRSKGLQFDHVLLYGLGRKTGQSDYPMLSWFDTLEDGGGSRKVISPIAPRADIDRDPIHRYIRSVDTEKTQHEIARLLYVACTRARASLHLIGHVALNEGREEIRAPRADCLLYRLWPAIKGDYESSFNPTVSAQAPPQSDLLIDPMLHRLQPDWALPAPREIVATAKSKESADVSSEVEFYWVGNDARIAGTLVHRWLQLIADGLVDMSASEVRAKRDLSVRWLREFGLSGDAGVSIVQRVEDAVVATLDDAQGRWALSGDGHAELRLSGSYNDELVNVIIDRVRIDDDGTHWIVDYKTSSHEGGNLSDFLAVEVDRYRPQLQRYAALYSAWAKKPPRCALYFPLLKSFVEVDV